MADEVQKATNEATGAVAAPQRMEIPSQEFTIVIEPAGERHYETLGPRGREVLTKPVYAMKLVHEKYGEMHHEANCADSPAFCIHKANKVIAKLRREDAERRGEDAVKNST